MHMESPGARRWLLISVVTLLVFSVWVAFALLVVNPWLHPWVPGYQVGRPCGWEYVALAASIGIAWIWTRRWPAPRSSCEQGVDCLLLPLGFIRFLLVYLLVAVLVFLWQYAGFMQAHA